MILADKITEERKRMDMTEELANQLGVSRQAVSKWEKCRSCSRFERIFTDVGAFWC